jgi:hypothetical protein
MISRRSTCTAGSPLSPLWARIALFAMLLVVTIAPGLNRVLAGTLDDPAAAPRIDARSVPRMLRSRPLADVERQYYLSRGLIRPNDATLRSMVPAHFMRPRGVAPRTLTLNATPGSAPTRDLAYYHGEILVNPVIIPVFWGFGPMQNGVPIDPTRDPNGLIPYVSGFLDHLAASPWFATLDEYYQDPGNQIQPVQAATLRVASPVFDLLPAPARYGNGDVFNEVQRLVTLGLINENDEEIILVITPHGSVNSDLLAAQACAAHYSYQSLNFFQVQHHYTYVSMPYMPDFGGSCGAGSVAGPLDGASIVSGHEIAEAITDPYYDYGAIVNLNHDAGWITADSSMDEIGDLCVWQDLQDTWLANGVQFPTQPLWSNRANACLQPQAPHLRLPHVPMLAPTVPVRR